VTKTKSYSFIQIDTSLKIAKNIKDESDNKLTTSNLIEYNDKISTNNKIKLK